MMMGNDGWMIDDVFGFAVFWRQSSTLIGRNGTLQGHDMNKSSCLLVVYK